MQYKNESFVHAYMDIIDDLLFRPQFVTSPRDQKIHEIINSQINITKPWTTQILNTDSRKTSKKYLAGELLWYFEGRNDLEFISKYSKFWENISDDGKTCNSAYGNLIFNLQDTSEKYTQFQWILESLKKDKDSRQAVMFVSRPKYQFGGVKDFICTLNYMFLIRDDVLYMTVNRRSQDIWFGLTYDFVWEYVLQQHIRHHLLEVYPNLELGPITINCNSLHLYERNFEQANLLSQEWKIAKDNKRELELCETIPQIDIPLVDKLGFVNSKFKVYFNGDYEDSESYFIDWLLKYS